MRAALLAALAVAVLLAGLSADPVAPQTRLFEGLFDLLLLACLLVFGRDQVPLLRRALVAALTFTIVSRFGSLQSDWAIVFQAAAGGCWLLALRIPTPLIVLRGDPPFPGSIKSMAGLPFVLWPMLMLFFLAPEMPNGWGADGWRAVIFAALGGASASRIGRVGPRSLWGAMVAMVVWGVAWTLRSLFAAGQVEAEWTSVGLVAECLSEAMLVGALLAADGPRISPEALAFAEAMDSEPEEI